MSYTSNLHLEKPGRGNYRWDRKLNNNFDLLDAGYGSVHSAIADLPEVYIYQGIFNGSAGTTIPLPKSVDAINEYAVQITPLSRAASIGDIYVSQTTSDFTVKCAGGNTADGFSAAVYYSGSVSAYGGSIYRRWYVSPSSAIADQGDAGAAGSLAWVMDQIGSAPAAVELPANHAYVISQDLTIPENIDLHPQPGALFSIDSGKTLTVSGTFNAGAYQVFAGDGTVVFGDGSLDSIRVEWWQNNTTPGTTDMTAAFQDAVDCAKAAISAGHHAPPIMLGKSVYLITRSIDATFSSSSGADLGGIAFVGQDRYSTKINAVLTEAYPAIDFTGNTGGKIKDLTLSAPSGSATTCLLCASPAAASQAGNNINIENAFIFMDYSGSGTSLVIYNSDLPVLKNVECRGPGGVTFGVGKPAAVSSRFQSLYSGDSTSGQFDGCIFLGNTLPPFKFTGGAQLRFNGIYAALVESGSAGMVIDVDAAASSGCAVYAYNLRTENQSSNGSTIGLNFATDSPQGGHIDGSLNNEVGISIAAGKTVARYDFNISNNNGTYPLFGGGGIVIESTIKTNAQSLGNIGSGSGNNTFIGELSYSEAFPDNMKGSCLKDGQWYDNRNTIYFPPGNTTKYMRMNGSIGLTYLGPVNLIPSYTGGSGEQLIGTITIPADTLTQPNMGSVPAVNLLLQIIGELSGSNANGRLRLELSDGTNTREILDHNPVPSGAGGLKIDVTILNVDVDSMRVITVSRLGAGMMTKYTNLNGSPISVTNDIDINIYETNDGNWGISPYQAILSMI